MDSATNGSNIQKISAEHIGKVQRLTQKHKKGKYISHPNVLGGL